MKVVILQTFETFPVKAPAEQWVEGWTRDVADDVAKSWIDKGLARAVDQAPSPSAAVAAAPSSEAPHQ